MSQVPVVAIGGILEAEQVRAAAQCGVDGVCVVRALGEVPAATVPGLQRALREGRERAPMAPGDDLPNPSLANDWCPVGH